MKPELNSFYYDSESDRFVASFEEDVEGLVAESEIVLDLLFSKTSEFDEKYSKETNIACADIVQSLFSTSDISIIKILHDTFIYSTSIFSVKLPTGEDAYLLSTEGDVYFFVEPDSEDISESTYWSYSDSLNEKFNIMDEIGAIDEILKTKGSEVY